MIGDIHYRRRPPGVLRVCFLSQYKTSRCHHQKRGWKMLNDQKQGFFYEKGRYPFTQLRVQLLLQLSGPKGIPVWRPVASDRCWRVSRSPSNEVIKMHIYLALARGGVAFRPVCGFTFPSGGTNTARNAAMQKNG